MKIYNHHPEFYSLWRSALIKKDTIKDETKFIIDCLKNSKKPIKTIIDLGGGTGLHSNLLEKKGFKVTLFDSSKKALEIAKKQNPKLIIKKGSFESINLKEKFDAAICMWTTFPYIINKKGRKKFFLWIREHINSLVILDEGNFYNYPNHLDEVYIFENNNNKIMINRKWFIDEKFFRKTIFENEITNIRTNKIKTIKDTEYMQFLTVEELKNLLGNKWKLDKTLGDYTINTDYNMQKSSRLISLFLKK